MIHLPTWLSWQWIFEKLLPVLTRLNPVRWFKRPPPTGAPPRETVRLHCERADWNLGTVNDEPAMQCHSRWRVTNIVDRNVELWTVQPILPWSLGRLFRGRPQVPIQHALVRHPDRDVYGHLYPVLAHETSEAS